MQICGMTVTQYRPGSGSSYPLYTYLLLFFQVFLSAISGVYNQSLYKNYGVSLHAANMFLYGSGAGINMMLHTVIRLLKADEPSLFSGYGSLEAKMLILNNVFVGLAITAVYKCKLLPLLWLAKQYSILIFYSRVIRRGCGDQMFCNSSVNRSIALHLACLLQC